MYRGRFAPSPTGRLHLGLARTALLGWLRARAQGGQFILRVEDLDRPRVVPGSLQSQLDDLRWLGLDWEEGPDVGGPHGPYVQSERLEHYEDALASLRASRRAYPCTCSRKEIAIASAPHGAGEHGPPYPGTCRGGPTHPERDPSWRLRMPEQDLDVEDRLLGPITAQQASGDFVICRADGVHAYQLAVVVDDAAMEITEVLRGADLAGCVAWQYALYDALDLRRPGFLHVPLMVTPEGERLAKRHGSICVRDYRSAGWSQAALVGLLASSVGLIAPGSKATPQDLISSFQLRRLPRVATPLHVSLDGPLPR